MDAQTAQEECKLLLAALESYRTGKMTPLLKEELKYQILSRRLSEGRDELTPNIQADMSRQDEHQQHQLRPEEIERIETRKEQNRKAAQKFRLKKKLEKYIVSKEFEEQKKKNSVLREKIKRLSSEKEMMMKIITNMFQEQMRPIPSPETDPIFNK